MWREVFGVGKSVVGFILGVNGGRPRGGGQAGGEKTKLGRC